MSHLCCGNYVIHQYQHYCRSKLQDTTYDTESTFSKDSGFGSLCTPAIEPTPVPQMPSGMTFIAPELNSRECPILDATPTLPLDAISVTPSDQGYISLVSDSFSDYNSLNSGSLSSIASGPSSEVIIRKKTDITRPLSSSSANPLSTSKLRTQSNKADSWHEDSNRRKLLLFAEKMDYSEAEFDQCMAELEDKESVDRDKLLKHLVKLRDSASRPRTGPVATGNKSTRTSSNNSSSSQHSPEGDSKGLRRIVIDGSNVAME